MTTTTVETVSVDAAARTRALNFIRATFPTATAASFETSDQNPYGFELSDVTLPEGDASEVAPELLDEARDGAWDDLCDLDWNGVMGEDRSGRVTIDLTTEPADAPNVSDQANALSLAILALNTWGDPTATDAAGYDALNDDEARENAVTLLAGLRDQS